MSNLEFRVYHLVSKEMIYPEKQSYVFQWLEEGQLIEIQQFTGIVDAEDRKIFAGDILYSSMTGRKYIVFWSDKNHGWYKQHIGDIGYPVIRIDMDASSHRVIGNIYTNAALLKD